MNQTDLTAEQTKAIFSTMADTMAEALGCNKEDITLTASLIDDLDAESIDFLDIVFRLEKEFQIKIPRGKILEDSRGSLSEIEFEQNGILTTAGLQQLKSYLNEVPADRFKTPLNVTDIPRLFTPETFLKIIIKAQQEQTGATE